MLIQDLQPIYGKYLAKLKPLIAEYESREEAFVTPLLHNLTVMFDSIAQYSSGKCDDNAKRGYKKIAEMNLDLAIKAVEDCIEASMMERVKVFKSQFPKKFLLTLDQGRFYGKFIKLDNEVQVDKENALPKLKELEKMIENCHSGALVSSLYKDNCMKKAFKWGISIIVALFLNFLTFRFL